MKDFSTGTQTKVPRAELGGLLKSLSRRQCDNEKDDVVLDFLGSLERTQMCGDLRAADAGENVVVMGWVNRRRDHGNLIFLDVRDRSGIAQVVLDKELTPEGH